MEKRRRGSISTAFLPALFELQRLYRRACDHRPIFIEPRAVARAVPGAGGLVCLEGAAQVRTTWERGRQEVYGAAAGVLRKRAQRHPSRGGEDLLIGAFRACDQRCKELCRDHGRAHPPGVEARGDEHSRRGGGVGTDVGHAVQGEAVLVDPAANLLRVGQVLFQEPLKTRKIVVFLPRQMVPASNQELVPIASQKKPGLGVFHHAHIQRRGVFHGYDALPALVHLHKIKPPPVHKGEVAGEDDALGPHRPGVCVRRHVFHLPHGAELIDLQPLRHGPQELEGVELAHPREHHRSGAPDPHGRRIGEHSRKAQLLHRVRLPAHFGPVRCRPHKGRPLLVVAFKAFGPFRDGADGLQIGIEVSPRFLRTEGLYQVLIERGVLGADHRRGTRRDAGADAVGLQHRATDPGVRKLPGDEDPRHAAADDQRLPFLLPHQGRIALSRKIPRPDRIHTGLQGVFR